MAEDAPKLKVRSGDDVAPRRGGTRAARRTAPKSLRRTFTLDAELSRRHDVFAAMETMTPSHVVAMALESLVRRYRVSKMDAAADDAAAG
jgi:hypothetical protein